MNVEIAQRLADRRKQAGLSQEALAARLGVSRQAVSKWERSESSPDTDNLIALAQLYGLSLDDLLYVDDEIRDDVTFEAADRAVKPTDEQPPSQPRAASPDKQSKVHIGMGGLHVEDGDEYVHMSWREGIHVKDAKKGDEVHVGWDGVHVNSHRTESCCGSAEEEAAQTYVPANKHRPRGLERAWQKFPYSLVVIVAYLLLGILYNAWGTGLFLFFTVPLYYMVGHAIGSKRIAPFILGAYPIVVVAWFCWMAFVLNEPHPAWVAFLTIPVVEWLVYSLSRWWRDRKRRKAATSNAPIDVEAN